jgi:single-stranded DNA-binding protein
MAKERKQTKSLFKIEGKVTRIDKDKAFVEDEGKSGKREGDTYRSLKFGVKSSQTNELTVEMFDYEPEQIFVWNSKAREEDPEYKGEYKDFEEWLEDEEELREEGYTVFQTRVGLEYGEDGKLISHGHPSYVASEMIHEGLDNGDSVVIEGEIRYSSYEQDGKTKERKTYTIKRVHRKPDIDFDAEDYEEVSYFEQEFVFVSAKVDKKENKTSVIGRIIDYKGDFHDTEFFVNHLDEDGEIDEDMETLGKEIVKTFSFGDVLKVYGDTVNRTILEEKEGSEDSKSKDKKKDKILAGFGGKKKPKHAESYTVRSYITEMQIHGVEDFDEAVYTEEDFVVEDVMTDKKKKKKAGLGGKKPKKGKKNPFEADDNETMEISDDDLPF